jgi:AAA+ ATPase superfamily predicted ATPase
MLFDLRPKEKLSDLYDRKDEYKTMKEQLNSGSWVVVLGKRMTGKTSLIKTYSNENHGIYINLLGEKSISALSSKLAAHAGIRLQEFAVSAGMASFKWTRLTEELFSRIDSNIVVLDEVQGISSPNFLNLLKNVWDSYRKIRFIFSGSYIGLMRNLLYPDAASPLYGRSPYKLVLSPFTSDESYSFLQAGFGELNKEIQEKEAKEVVTKLNGYVGWLTYYGNMRCIRRLDHEKALDLTIKEGIKIVISELNAFLKGRNRSLYVKALRKAADGCSWSDVKRATNANNKVVTEILQRLKAAMIIDEEDGLYTIGGPLMRRAIVTLRY